MSTAIEWCDETWNPTRGCRRVSAGCENCYAEKVAHRFGGPRKPYEGLTKNGRWNGQIRLVPEMLTRPVRWRKPRRVFVDSMSDLFHDAVPFEFIAKVFGAMAGSPQHTFIVLTKRDPRPWFRWMGERSREYAVQPWEMAWLALSTHTLQEGPSVIHVVKTPKGEVYGDLTHGPKSTSWPLPNVILGVSVEDQPTADERIPWLLETPAATRAVSYEPALGPVDFREYLYACESHPTENACACRDGGRWGLDWIIVGSESRPGKRPGRPAEPEWFRSARDQCARASVPFFLKQMDVGGKVVPLPELDGVQWAQFPEVA